MRHTPLLFALSVVGNAVLAVWIIAQRQSGSIVDESHDRPAASSTSTAAAMPTGTDRDEPVESAWARLQPGGSDAELVARLRSHGFPLRTIRTIVRAEIEQRHLARSQAIEAMAWEKPWWQVPAYDESATPQSRAARRALQREIESAVNEALGVDATLFTPTDVATARRTYGDLDLEKLVRIQAISRDYGELRAEVWADAQGVILSEDRQRLCALEDAERADLAHLLTAGELAEFDRHASPTANDLRWKLRNFHATEAEYLALYEIRKEFDACFGPPNNLSPEARAARTAAEPELNATIAAMLSPERFREFEISTASTYENVRSIVDQFELPATTVSGVVALQLEITKQADVVRKDPNLPAEQRARRLAALADEATARVSGALGAKAFAEYKSTTGSWIDQLRPPPTP